MHDNNSNSNNNNYNDNSNMKFFSVEFFKTKKWPKIIQFLKTFWSEQKIENILFRKDFACVLDHFNFNYSKVIKAFWNDFCPASLATSFLIVVEAHQGLSIKVNF